MLFSFLSAFAQPEECDGRRYIFSGFDVDSTIAVPFGQSVTLGGDTLDLAMDIYEPKDDDAPSRPLVVLAHGGAFVQGDRTQLRGLSTAYAEAGYVCATISYRLIDIELTDSTTFGEGVIMAIADMKAAIRYFRQNAAGENTWRINPNTIYAGGASAGAVMAANLAMLDQEDDIPEYIQELLDRNGGFEGNTNDITDYTSEVQGAILYSGSILRTSWMDAGDPPYVAFHEEFDPIVPCGYASSAVVDFPAFSYGACAMQTRAEEIGLKQTTTIYQGDSSHVGYFSGFNLTAVVFSSFAFLEDLYCNQTNTVSIDPSLTASLELYPNPASDKLIISTDAVQDRGQMEIIDLEGRSLFKENVQTNAEISLPDLASGIYQVIFTTQEGRRAVKKLLIH
ncbi:MAG: T9SS type A sorting domain-containing protein [Bacteroidota bacterium]